MIVEGFEDIIFEKEENGLCTVTISKPEIRNAVTYITFYEILKALEDMKKDKSARVLILTGDPRGDAFTSGGYFKKEMFHKMRKYPDIDLMDIAQKKLCLKFWEFEKPVIAAINGMAIGGGVTMPMACADLIYMAEDAWFGFFFARRGIVPEFALNFILPFLLGFQKAKEICYFGKKVSAQEAYELGLVNKVLTQDRLINYAREQALRLIPPKGPSLSIKLMKKTMHAYFRDALSQTLDLENKALRKLFASHDFKESMRALKEKRDAVFIGR
ncbi:MAG: enoyl-CoA hydratase [Candidatus Lokiarchaeota archaeon]|nr:enoyl-CoA hydratase [Candidatus Lokiarchaeota archaeon]MBD3338151.1 enoyl-CoA hydratase [Candidatus Lokiarchaeota archaeon]